MGGMVSKMKSAKQRRLDEEEAIRSGKMEPREMVTPMLRKALSKQGGRGLMEMTPPPGVVCLYQLYFLIRVSYSRVPFWCQALSLDQVHVEGAWRLLQTHLLWYRESPVHGDHAQSRLRQQVRVLLEVGVARQLTPTFFYSVCVCVCACVCTYVCVCVVRHHTNPVGTEWRWKMDDPDTILQGALENHYQMVKQFKGQTRLYNSSSWAK